MNPIQEFTLMQDFLSLFDPEIEPRDGKPLSDSHRKLLERIARGEASNKDRDQALPVLLKNSSALRFLAQQLNQEIP